jgi:peptidoglycan-associated lipoprotein
MAESLKANPNVEIQIQGNTDDRGSTEYNMALGQKRAQSLKNYFKANGVENSIETISYGKERPAVQGNNEQAWSKNRRDDVVKTK